MDNIKEKILSAVMEYTKTHSYSPSFREIAELCGVSSTSTIHRHVLELINSGKLETDCKEGTPRAIRIPGYYYLSEDELREITAFEGKITKAEIFGTPTRDIRKVVTDLREMVSLLEKKLEKERKMNRVLKQALEEKSERRTFSTNAR